jgi:hypothetical protein
MCTTLGQKCAPLRCCGGLCQTSVCTRVCPELYLRHCLWQRALCKLHQFLVTTNAAAQL